MSAKIGNRVVANENSEMEGRLQRSLIVVFIKKSVGADGAFRHIRVPVAHKVRSHSGHLS